MNQPRILVAYDGAEEARAALLRAAQAAASTGAQIGVVTVMPDAILPSLDAAAAEAMRILRDRKLEPHLHAPIGDPATEILRVADEGAYDTIYVGRRPAGSLARTLLGSVSAAVGRRFRRTVIVE